MGVSRLVACKSTIAFVSCFALASLSPGMQSQQGAGKPGTLEGQLILADRQAVEGKGDEARKLYEEVAARAHAEGAVALEARALASIGRMLSSAAKYGEARQYLERALSVSEAAGDGEGIARASNSLGIVAESMGRRDEARIWYGKSAGAAEGAGKLQLQVTARLNLAGLDIQDRKNEEILRDAAEVARKLGDKGLEARALHQWGDALFGWGDFGAAMEKLEEASALYELIGGRDDLARVSTSMGRLNRAHGRPAEAIPFYEKALRIQEAVGDKVGVIQSLNAMGVAYALREDLKRAGECYEEAYALALQTDSPRVIDFMRANLASNLIDRKEYGRAAELLEEVLRRGAESNPEYRHVQLARAYMLMNRLTEARDHADRAVEISRKNVNRLPAALLQRAEVRNLQGDLPGALEDAGEAIRVIEGIRAKLVPLDFMKLGFSSLFQNGYSLLIGLYHRSGKPDQALEVAELARSRAFLDLLATKEVRLRADDETAIAALRTADRELRALGIDPAAAMDSSRGRSSPSVSGETALLLKRWKEARPELLSFVAATPHKIPELESAAVRLHSTLVSYWVANDALYIWVVRPGSKVELRQMKVTEKHLAGLVKAAALAGTAARVPSSGPGRGANGLVSATTPKGEWQELYRLLVQPVRQLLPPPGSRLTIIPHGPLTRLPFAALLSENGRYLLEDYALHYVPAGALLEFTAAKKRNRRAGGRFLLVADPSLPVPAKGEAQLPPLPGARVEVQSIAGLFPAGTVIHLQGPRADKQTVTASLVGASRAHFATHSVIRDDQPLDSYLALGRGKAPIHDGRLTAQEIYGHSLHSDLVVLSSCLSGGGRVTGDGLSALARAFFYAGVPSLVVSLWDVADQPASRLLPDFYRSMLRGRDKIEALREAQLRLLADLRAGRVTVRTPAGDMVLPELPILWAGFALLGEP